MFPHCTISSAMSVATSRSISAGVMDVVPPLMWPTTSGAVSSTTSALIGLLPAIEGPPVWMVTVMPWARAQRTIGAASLPVFTEPRPISPTRRTPAAAIRGAPLADDERVGIERRPADVAADERADVADERGHRGAPPSRECVKSEVKTQPPRTPQIEARHGVAAARRASEGVEERRGFAAALRTLGGLGAMSGPPFKLGGPFRGPPRY